jgi:hypothetical protein
MKTITICLALLMLANTIYSQPGNPSAPLTKQDYLKKSKNQKTAAWILMAGGIGLTYLGIQMEDRNDSKSESTGKAVAIISGVTAIVVSTTLFILATENKKRGSGLSIRMEKIPRIQQRNFVYRSYPALSFRLSL